MNAFNQIEAGKISKAYFFTPIFAPLGLKDEIVHIWKHNGEIVSTIKLGKITGGREQGFRTWSKHELREGQGTYSIEVWTKGRQLIGRGGFELTGEK